MNLLSVKGTGVAIPGDSIWFIFSASSLEKLLSLCTSSPFTGGSELATSHPGESGSRASVPSFGRGRYLHVMRKKLRGHAVGKGVAFALLASGLSDVWLCKIAS